MNDDAAAEQPPSAPAPPSDPAASRPRYEIADGDDGPWIVCRHNPNLFFRVERGMTVRAGGRKRYPRQTIFLDGAYGDAPFYDNAARQYSLDHHEGCVRAFTLATCEQAAVLLLQGLPLAEGEWRLYANEPDMDALLAAWLLLNHVELLQEEATLLARAMPFVRVAGVIDAHGFEMGLLTALPEEVQQAERARLDALLARERQLKEAGAWADVDVIAYARDMLEALDRLHLPPDLLDTLAEVEEAGRAELEGGKLAILCRSRRGIYEVEERLRERLGKRLGLIVLDQGGGRFTLRQVDSFLPGRLSDLYRRLNRIDPAASEDDAGTNTWGGSDDIGGSPRRTGSRLSGDEVLDEAARIYGGGGFFRRLWHRIGG